ncbi:DUF1499 domain-containing protein [Simiduia curdlanivorans]|uniref:DUF1499 domain-containing protein n=1 Tax=Simiduia curdlanivorans TaxID=1492769 RepID=A0ABV8V230_9GAMM|nr:DUF1499 domain-containing protein [Simiduia curdlanivorans]MDN3640155.1 DUF1499 domain-containing protein [Simiduia curdlanivorans]
MNKPWMRWLLWIQVGLLVVLLLSMLANKFALVEFKLAFLTFYKAIQVVILVSALGLVGLIVAWWRKQTASIRPALFTVLLGLAPVLMVLAIVGQGLKVPAIHNITTDLQNPPEFVLAYENRAEGLNSLDAPSDAVRDMQRDYYPQLGSLTLAHTPAQSFELALAACKGLGLEVTHSDQSTGHIEAIEETLFFGFKDDVVIRVMPVEAGSQIDLRSVSRVGRSDLGANAKRIERILAAIKSSAQ